MNILGSATTADLADTRKSLRIRQACDTCHKRGRRCRRDEEANNASCLTCREAGLVCTRSRIAAKRGPKPRRVSSLTQSHDVLPERPGDGQHVLETFLVTSFFEHVYPM